MTIMTSEKVIAEPSKSDAEDGSDDELNELSDWENENDADIESDDNQVEKRAMNLGWADSVLKVLKTNRPKGKKTLVLSKAKKVTDLKRKAPEEEKKVDFEIVGEIKEEKLGDEIKEEKISEAPPRKKKKDILSVRVKPNILDKDRERTLSKIATRGVVQLFNAVRIQQKDIAVKLKEAGPLERKRNKVLKNIDKRSFLDVLMGNSKSEEVDNTVKDESVKEESDRLQKNENSNKQKNENSEKTSSTWSVLRDDFMMGAKLKDWDKNLTDDEDEHEQIDDPDSSDLD